MKVLAALFLSIFSSTLQAIDIKPSHSGNWFNPYQAGHGFDVQVIEGGETVIFWYTYDADGEPIWIFAQGPNEGNTVTATAYWHDGMRWNDFNREDLNQQIWGTITIEFHSCNSATVRYDSEYSWGGVPFGSGTIQVKRLTSTANNKCTENLMGGNYLLAGVNSSRDSLIGSAIVFENGATIFGTFVTNGSLAEATVGIGQITEQNNGRFMMEVFEVAVDGSWSGESILLGENIPGRFTVEEDNAVLYGVELRHDFMTQIPVSAVARSWAISDITGQSAGSINLDAAGAVSGDVLAGCSVAGNWFFPDSQFNQIWMNLEFNNCSTAGETYAAAKYDPRELRLEILGLNEHSGFILIGQ